MSVGFAQYVAAFAISFAVATGLTPVMRAYALKRAVLDSPDDGRKVQSTAIPYLGGIAIASAVTLVLFGASLLRGFPSQDLPLIAGVLVPALVLSIVGLVDDVKGLTPLPRFMVQSLTGVVTAAALRFTGTGAQLSGVVWIDFGITVVWIVGVTNALNLLDNTDGAASGTATIAALGFFGVASLNGQFLVAALALVLSGACGGFLIWNKKPARIYMGDSGSLFIGFLLAAIAIRIDIPSASHLQALAIPVLVLFMPILDTSIVVVARLRRGDSPFLGGLDHVAHRLRRVTSGTWAAVGSIWGIGGVAAVSAIVISLVSAGWATLLVALASVAFVLVFGFIIRLPEHGEMR